MEHAVREVVGGWKQTEDHDRVRRWVETLHADVAAGLFSAEDRAGDADGSDPTQEKQAAAVVAALRATLKALAGEMQGL